MGRVPERSSHVVDHPLAGSVMKRQNARTASAYDWIVECFRSRSDQSGAWQAVQGRLDSGMAPMHARGPPGSQALAGGAVRAAPPAGPGCQPAVKLGRSAVRAQCRFLMTLRAFGYLVAPDS